jgi:hypothetical protein
MGKLEKIIDPPARAALAGHIADRDAKADAVVRAKASAARANEMVAEAERHAETVKAVLASVRTGHESSAGGRGRRSRWRGNLVSRGPLCRDRRD